MNDIQKAQAARILSCYGETSETLLEKGGEGSKGGKVIGHTKSGKPIYEHADHAKMTINEHISARSNHNRNAYYSEKDSDAQQEHAALAAHHNEHAITRSHDSADKNTVLDHTRSGKPIYTDPYHPAHADFSKEDHQDAARAHNSARFHLDIPSNDGRKDRNEKFDAVVHHNGSSSIHDKASKSLKKYKEALASKNK